ncbi:hypothetical protein CLHOM_02050 [Clostridium homopropionicum DSM 5847]|uniref:Uncharacterized protein n=1 Tax=Clostridium homopropionicum DSM 5847 TaxID=1121318 RepID=A0A0L6ZEW8_9CLOT|nr:hypothetical protein CLHOM_02050 [Clostridium homopropionicum DSM 5847]
MIVKTNDLTLLTKQSVLGGNMHVKARSKFSSIRV